MIVKRIQYGAFATVKNVCLFIVCFPHETGSRLVTGVWPYCTAVICWISALSLMVVSSASAELVEDAAAEIFETAGIKGGLIVHVGCDNGRLTAALQTNDSCLVQGLDTNAQKIAQARRQILSLGHYGSVSFDRFDGVHLPYIDNLVNLLIVEPSQSVSNAELLRVLAPEGIALIRDDGQWRRVVKPRPVELDAWTHFLHGADGNAVANDTVVDTPHRLQWTGAPRYARTHEGVPTVNVAVSDGKRIYYIADTATVALPQQLPTKWTLLARDAFNGVVLWQRPLNRWQARSDGSRHRFPPDLFRRLVAGERHLYATLDILGPVTALDPATGATVRVYDGTDGAEEILYANGKLYVVLNPAAPETIDRGQLADVWPLTEPKQLMAIDVDTGRTVWQKNDPDTLGLAPMSTAVRDGRLVFQTPREVVCLNAADGQVEWRTKRSSPERRPVWGTPTLVLADDVVLSADRISPKRAGQDTDLSTSTRSELIAYNLSTGQQLWAIPCAEGSHVPNELFVLDGLVWAGERPSRSQQDYRFGRDLHTGEIRRTLPQSDAWVNYHHHRCYRDKATSRFILAGRTGVEFLDVTSGQLTPHRWIRGICKFGILPCNGLLYIPPNQCSCYQESLLNGFNALAPESRVKSREPRAQSSESGELRRLERGPAYGEATSHPSSFIPHPFSDWPTYRADAARSGFTSASLPDRLDVLWRANLGAGRLTAPVISGSHVSVAAVDQHTVYTLDAESGQTEWCFTAGGRIDSPPTWADGMAVFGCRDGWIYALRATDGALVWRSLAAPRDERLVADGQCESVWPVHGSVLVENDRVYCAAGRYSDLDGGITCRILDLRTGRVLVSRQYNSRDEKTGAHVDLYDPFGGALLPDRELPGILPDVPSSDGDTVFLRSVAFDREFHLTNKYERHLFAAAGFVDDAWYQRLFWTYGNHLFSGLAGRGFNKSYPSVGRILVHDERTLYGYRDYTLDAEGVFAIEMTAGLGVFDSSYPLSKQAMKRTKSKSKGKSKKSMLPFESWHQDVPFYVRAMAVTADSLVLAGPPKHEPDAVYDLIRTRSLDTNPPPPLLETALDAWNGKHGGRLWLVNKVDGTQRVTVELASPPVHDGLAIAGGRLFVSAMDGSVVSLGKAD